jgi:hypothetical protein
MAETVVPRPASTILLLRDSAAIKGEIEVFMMVRHYEIDFSSGALVFPGGSVDKSDNEIIARSELYSGGEGLDAVGLSFRIAAIDGRESTDSIWVSPREALAGGESGRFKLPFPTTRNLIRLGKQSSVKAALGDMRGKPIVTVMPVMTKLNGGRQLRIPREAGYDGEVFEVGAV